MLDNKYYPFTIYETLALIWLNGQNLKDVSPAAVYRMYQDACDKIKAAKSED